MSKSFDEGGAKGLLLANLGVSKNGCSIVFDSTLEEQEEQTSEEKASTLDLVALKGRLEIPEGGIHSLGLVPQLESLRAQQQQLAKEGFQVEEKVGKSRQYAPDEAEEKEADQSIHQDALERSQAGGKSFLSAATSTNSPAPTDFSGPLLDDNDDYAADDFGADDDDDVGFDAFLANEDGNRYSDISFSGSATGFAIQDQPNTLLDALSQNPSIMLASNDYAFVDNTWAGASHWRKKKTKTEKPKAATTSKKRPRKAQTFVDLSAKFDPSLLAPPAAKKADPLVWTPASVSKYSATDHLLPVDANITSQTLVQLSLRPSGFAAPVVPKKVVGFALDNDYWDDGDDDGGGVFDGGDDDQIYEMDDVRKVERTRVQYAMVAKKVDVKRLKKDLWQNLDENLHHDAKEDEGEEEEEAEEPAAPAEPLSFQATVAEMEQSQGQPDVTLPFYFICVLHLANEKGLALESRGLEDFVISSN